MNTFWKAALAVVVVVALVGLGFLIYRVGYSQGIAANLGLEDFPRFGFIQRSHIPEDFGRLDGVMGRFARFTDRGIWIGPYSPGGFGIAGPLVALGFVGLLVVGAIAAIALIIRRNPMTAAQEPDNKAEK